MLHATLKKLDKDLDFSANLNPLLADTGPAVAHVPKLAKQIACMKKNIDDMKNVRQEEEKVQADFLRQSPAQTSGGSGCSAATPRPHAARDRGRAGRGRRALSPPEDIVPKEVKPAWGKLKRYAVMDCATYASVEATARGQITNNYLHFENIRQAALPGDFTLILIG